jgi:hypothetical protein
MILLHSIPRLIIMLFFGCVNRGDSKMLDEI